MVRRRATNLDQGQIDKFWEVYMKIQFYSGIINEKDRNLRIWWATAPFECIAFYDGDNDVTRSFEPTGVLSPGLIMELILPEICEDDARVLIINLLRGRYLERRDITKDGESVLFMMVNEAINLLHKIATEI